MINKPTILLRSLVRRAGFIEPILRLTKDEHTAQLQELRDEYRANPVKSANANIAGHDVEFYIDNETDYTIVRALREESFTDAIFAAVQPGDTVWDVGGNIGFVSVPLGKALGGKGKVYAFEPVPACREALAKNVELNAVECVDIVPCAVAAEAATVKMVTDQQVAAGTHHIAADSEAVSGNAIDVQVVTGDGFLAEHPEAAPNVIKIDIEGFEYDALRGMTGLLKNPACRAVFVEVHFGLLDARGQRYAPLQIVELFKDAGFTDVDWIDRSHLAATRS